MPKYNKKALIVLGSLALLMTSTFFLFPIRVHSKPNSSQVPMLTIYVTDQQKPGVDFVNADFIN